MKKSKSLLKKNHCDIVTFDENNHRIVVCLEYARSLVYVLTTEITHALCWRT
jgi:hypothetical protein